MPCSELERANLQYNQLAVTYQKVLSQQTAYTATAATLEQQKVCVCVCIIYVYHYVYVAIYIMSTKKKNLF